MKNISLVSALFLAGTLFAETPADKTKKDAKPSGDKCLVSVSQATFDADKACMAMDVSACGKAISTCQWNGKERKCRGYLTMMCVSNVKHRCDGGIEAVAKFPDKTEGTVTKFRCSEKTPLSVKKI